MYRGPQAEEGKVARGLLGDCFLLRIEQGGARAFVLIDCGVLTGTPDARGVMRAVAEDIRATCDGRLDLVIATHQHADHLSGFAHAADLFFGGKIAIGEVWFAWTEDPDDDQARELRARFDQGRIRLERLAAPGPHQGLAAVPRAAVAGLDAFFAAAPVGTGAHLTTGEIIGKLRDAAGQGGGGVRYLGPGAVVRTPGAVSLDAIVLGPPRDRLLFKNLPTKRGNEVYASPRGSTQALIDDALDSPQDDRSSHSPFAPGERRLTEASVRAVKNDPPEGPAARPDDAARQWLRRRYYDDLPPDQPSRGGDTPDQSRRRIDGDWLAAAGEFALKLDSDTNNTSLVIAFALPGGDFMLFAGDAQVGNWESWHSQPYAFGGKMLSATQILRRTRLYKVAHHGSHNATLKGRGLALMTHPALVAMMSTDEAFAKEPARGWRMPAGNTRRALLDATRGRLIRGDRRWRDDPDVAAYPASGDFIDRLDEGGGLFVEYRVCGEAASAARGETA